jgi:hypothetical protein
MMREETLDLELGTGSARISALHNQRDGLGWNIRCMMLLPLNILPATLCVSFLTITPRKRSTLSRCCTGNCLGRCAHRKFSRKCAWIPKHIRWFGPTVRISIPGRCTIGLPLRPFWLRKRNSGGCDRGSSFITLHSPALTPLLSLPARRRLPPRTLSSR